MKILNIVLIGRGGGRCLGAPPPPTPHTSQKQNHMQIFDSAPQLPKIKSLLPGSLKMIAISPCSLKYK